jgi:hypothetical protein
MMEYYKERPMEAPEISFSGQGNKNGDDQPLSAFDKHRVGLLSKDSEEGWASELRRYIGTMQRDVKKDTDIVEWWQVSN